jgi:hypothetical protein
VMEKVQLVLEIICLVTKVSGSRRWAETTRDTGGWILDQALKMHVHAAKKSLQISHDTI